MERTDKAQAKAIHEALTADPGKSISFEAAKLPVEQADEQTKRDLAALFRDGFLVIEGVLTTEQIETARAGLRKLTDGSTNGRNGFEGELTERVYGLPAKTRCCDEMIEHPRVLNLLDCILEPNYLLSAMQCINIHPGETMQPYHTDDAFIKVPRPHQPFGVATVWALTDFTAETGATMVFPGSHKVADFKDFSNPVPCVMPAGSVVVFLSTLWHGGGANVTKDKVREAITFQYCEPYCRPQENVLLGFDPAQLAEVSPKMRSLLGLSIHPPFIGHFDGKHPLKSPWATGAHPGFRTQHKL
ncbi:Uncharacterized protein Rv3633 [Durusdinium trenchii]|uniref:Uncharacterized protein Rv3633 n=1 Tax=Durusdinium trenchii TaxID=1381693 RepID=A0ABP0IFQ7_9DINO